MKKAGQPDGFLSLKEFHRAVNVEMQAIKKMKAIDKEMKAGKGWKTRGTMNE